jgi:hypothetical protein
MLALHARPQANDEPGVFRKLVRISVVGNEKRRPNTGIELMPLCDLKIVGISQSDSILAPVLTYHGGAANAQVVGPLKAILPSS